MTRAEAIEKAVDQLDPGDELTIHAADCTDTSICTCTPILIRRCGGPSKPIGFRPR